jgi:hypothetical protein
MILRAAYTAEIEIPKAFAVAITADFTDSPRSSRARHAFAMASLCHQSSAIGDRRSAFRPRQRFDARGQELLALVRRQRDA